MRRARHARVMFRARASLTLLPLLAACAIGGGDSTGDSSAPLVGVDGSTDHADRNCHVVLRELARLRDGTPFGYQTNGDSWVWGGTIDISTEASNEGLAPALLYHVAGDPTWHLAAATASEVPAPAGFARWDVQLDHDLVGPSSPDLTTARIELVPFLALDGGGRLFDHNRFPGDFDNYTTGWDTDFIVRPADAVCPAVGDPPPARLVFRADFTEEQIGGIVPGAEVRVEYDAARLPQCRHWRNGHELWDITVHLRWEPSGALVADSVRDGAATFAVPTGAERAVLWFENTSAIGCQAWDSDFGANYPFAVLAPPAWIGHPVARFTRDTSDTCDGGGGIDGFAFDTWTRQRAAITNACLQVWEPGVTDVDGVEVWKALDVSVRWRGAGTGAYRSAPAMFDRRVGNDARFAFNLRTIDPFRAYHCPDVPTAPTEDGMYLAAPIELYFVVNGVELRADGGAPFTGTYVDYLSDPFRDASCQ
jgi:hypothetical protein